MMKPMLAKDLEWRRITYPCIAHLKLDGNRGVYENGAIYTRTLKLIVGLDHITSYLSSIDAPCLDGELMIPGLTFQQASGEFRSFRDKPTATFNLFDIPGHTLRTQVKLNHLEEYTGPHVNTIPYIIARCKGELEAYYNEAIREGHEGLMVKPMEYDYVPRRSYNYMRMKERKTMDLKVVGTYEGSARLTGTLGGIIVHYKGGEVRVGSGFSDEDRDRLWAQELRGLIAEIAFDKETDGGSLRQPTFIRWRTMDDEGNKV